MKKTVIAVAALCLAAGTPVYSFAADPCEVVLCMYGKATGNSCGRKIKCHPNYRTLQRSNSCKNPFKTMTYFNSAICKRFVGMEAGIIKVSS